jgi:FixJ family two-component response regulator
METRPFVAIVDDDRLSRIFLANMLESAGISSVCFEFPDYFLDYADVYKPACIILDMSTPGLYGTQVECQLSEIGSAAPVIVVAGDSDIQTATAALHYGAVDAFTKPIDRLKLLRRVRRILMTNTDAQEGRSLAA